MAGLTSPVRQDTDKDGPERAHTHTRTYSLWVGRGDVGSIHLPSTSVVGPSVRSTHPDLIRLDLKVEPDVLSTPFFRRLSCPSNR